jgi:hypothetical protein
MRVRMRMRDASIGAGAVLAVVVCALVPVWMSTPTEADAEDPYRVPTDLFHALVEECQGVVPLAVDQIVLPNWFDADGDIDSRVWLELYGVDPENGGLASAEPTAEQAALLAAANSCLAAYEMEGWQEPPQFDEFHRNMYYDYVAEALVPCLAARGIDARVPSRKAFATLDEGIWYQARLVGLDFPEALETWRACPPFPEYLKEAGNRPDPVEVLDLG